MATNVIHGTGKPRFVLPTGLVLGFDGTNTTIGARTVGSSTPTTVTLAEATDLTSLNLTWELAGTEVFTLNSGGGVTYGVIQSFNDTSDTLTVDSWNNGNPNTAANLYLKGKAIDLPYCQRLTEYFIPDYITKKMVNGEIRFKKRGFYYRASLDYSKYLHKDEVSSIIKYIFSIGNNGFGFYPRKDNFALFYAVDIDQESNISFYQLQNHQGHGGIIIDIVGKQRLSSIPYSDSVVVSGYGESYGEAYGYGL